MSDHIPQEVLLEIFIRMPVKSLLRCRCVCKSWHSLISNQNFISMHSRHAIDRSRSNSSNNNCLLLRHYSRANKKERFTLHFDDDDLFNEYQELGFPLESSWDYFEIVGSCNGIVCLTDNHSHALKRIVLWNPSIGLSVTLPLQRISYRVNNVVLGFGFDSRTDDYKVIRIVYYSTCDSLIFPPEVEIFELSKGTWRISNSATVPDYEVSKYSSQIVLKGAIHWVGYYNPKRLIVAIFHVHDEEFKEFNTPEGISGGGIQNLSVMLCGQWLSVIQYKKRRGHLCYESCCIWVMNEYGVEDSWTRLFNVVVGGGLGKVLGLRNNFEVLLVGGEGELISYDPWNQGITSLGIYGESCAFYADFYVESLVLLKSQKGSISSKKKVL